jgi:hypothetical protein
MIGPQEIRKIEEILKQKWKDIQETPPHIIGKYKIWVELLEKNGCRRISSLMATILEMEKEEIRIKDPSQSGYHITMPKDLAFKVMVFQSFPE